MPAPQYPSISVPPPEPDTQKPVPKPRHQADSNPAPPKQPTPAPPPQAQAQPRPGSAMDISRAQKLCKFASSALDYQDVVGAVDFLQKAINLLKTGKEE